MVMPNHFHGILGIDRVAGDGIDRAATRAARTTLNHNIVGAALVAALNNENKFPALKNDDISPARINNLGNIIGAFKSMFVLKYIDGVNNKNWPRFYKRLWQRDYYERIIRNKQEYMRIEKYIKNNPENWIKKSPR